MRDRLAEEYGDFEVVEKEWRHPSGFYDDLVDRFESGDAGGAGAWVYDEEGRVLLLRQDNRPGWTDAGGKRQPGESFEGAAKRVVREATGVDVEITGVLECHRIEVYDGTDPERPHLFEPIVVFTAEYVDGDPEPGERGIAEVDWFAEPPAFGQYEDVEGRPIPFEG